MNKNDGYVTIGVKLDTTELDGDMKDVENKLNDIGKKPKFLSGLANTTGKVVKSVGSMASSIFSTIGGIVKGVIGGITKIAFATIGVTSALGLISLLAGVVAKAFEKVVTENKELLANIRYIVFVISNALAPVTNAVANMIASAISKILNLLAKVITYMAYIIKAWFGIDILAGSSVSKFKEASSGVQDTAKGLGKASKNAKELKKQLAGFDEMNILQDNSNKDTGGTGGGIGGGAGGGLGDMATPTLKFGGEIPEWIKWIADHKDEVIAGLFGIAGGLGAVALGYGLIKSLGIGLIIGGIVYLIEAVLDYLKDPTWENFWKILGAIAVIVAGVALVFGGIPALITAIVLLIGALGLAIYKNWDKIKAVLSKVGDWIKTNVIDPVVEFFKALWNKIKEIFTPVINFFASIIKTIIDNIKITIDNIKQILSALWNAIKSIFGPVFQWIYDKVIKPIAEKFTTLWEGIKTGVKGAVDIIKNIFNGVISFFNNIITKIVSVFKTIGTKVGDAIGKAFKSAINFVLGAIERILNTPINAINGLIKAINKLPGLSLTKLNTFNLPRLAKGGIVNLPGSGVMVGSAIAGERGAEGVIPLTDSQQMALLGEAIGKYITVNANITNSMNGRVISRELQKIQNDNNFAYNR